MVTKLQYVKLIEKTYEVVEAIKTSELYHSYKEYEHKVLNDNCLQEILDDFQDKKHQFEEAYQYKAYYPKYNKIKREYQQSKIKLMHHDLFREFKIYEKELDAYIYEIELRLKNVLNIKEKHGKININFK